MTKEQILKIENTYRAKKVFVTGHTGFKGAWLIYWLHSLGANVKGYSLEPLQSDALYSKMNGDAICQSIIGDVRDQQRLVKELNVFEPDFVFHLAAQPLVRLSYEFPTETFDVNALGTANVLEAMRQLNKPCVGVMITTDKVYDNMEWLYPYRETDRLGGYDPYSASKACAELVISSYRNSFFNLNNYEDHRKAIAVARAGNVIGGGDWAKDRIIPDIVRALKNNQIVRVRNPKAVRPWQHVLEPLGGYLLLGAALLENPIKYASAWNFGPLAADNMEVLELVNIALKVWGSGNYTTPELMNEPHEAGLLKLDISKASNELDWKPKWFAKTAIEKTLIWYKAYISQENVLDLMKRDIEDYSTDNF